MNVATQLKSIRFPKIVINDLDKYAREEFGIPFSRYIVFLATDKLNEIKKTKTSIPISLISSYLEAEVQLKNGVAEPLQTDEEIKKLLEDWKQD